MKQLYKFANWTRTGKWDLETKSEPWTVRVRQPKDNPISTTLKRFKK